jgi:hypothetical protein
MGMGLLSALFIEFCKTRSDAAKRVPPLPKQAVFLDIGGPRFIVAVLAGILQNSNKSDDKKEQA